ncbi:MAG TPA: STAS domain-containing protein [Candidatus Binatia bacterium]|nr:STAS domain-containing protein [Candidatus Binatia bacterium]HET9880848.1 STAS domain-containing protein [Candidatus Binatia bacterium]
MTEQQSKVAQLLRKNERDVLQQWLSYQISATTMRADLIKESDLREQSRRFLQLFTAVVQQNGDDENTGSWKSVKDMLGEVSRSRVAQGFSPSETATFVFSLKQPMFDMLRREIRDVEELCREIWATTALLDKLGLYTTEAYLHSRESIISRQQQELMELSTPVVQLWDNVLALPLIGTLDSERTQVVMENLLEKVVETGASIAIIDITGVPTVDTLVAQHLLKTVAAARLMGADCIISGIRPQIAQTIVHLGINLADIITKATLADAFAIALQRTGAKVTRVSGKQ